MAQSFAKFAPQRRAKYLEALRHGHTRQSAAQSVGVSFELVRLYRKAYPEFDEQQSNAEMDANGKVQSSLFAQAIKGNVAACFGWLYNRDRENWKYRNKPEEDDALDLSRLTPAKRRQFESLLEEVYGAENASPSANGQTNGVPG